MPEARDREQLGDALDERDHDGLEIRHPTRKVTRAREAKVKARGVRLGGGR